ncbi:histidine phosphatase family protein [Candidatus Woesearchaeota archaeon]|nr:histidine phosphatase family protein [Candidatus Woesearchaeota archaeon]
MRLILTRHGETEENKAGIILGHLPGVLSALGKEQARKLADRLSKEHIDAIYSSDLARAVDTTKEIMKLHLGIPIHYTPALRERSLGEFEGKFRNEVGWPSDARKVSGKKDPPGGENFATAFDRATVFLRSLLNKHARETVLCVAHSGINRAMIAAIMGKTPERIPEIEYQKHASITIIHVQERESPVVEMLNATGHL